MDVCSVFEMVRGRHHKPLFVRFIHLHCLKCTFLNLQKTSNESTKRPASEESRTEELWRLGLHFQRQEEFRRHALLLSLAG